MSIQNMTLTPKDKNFKPTFKYRKTCREKTTNFLKFILTLPLLPITGPYRAFRQSMQKLIRPLIYQAYSGGFKKKLDDARLEKSRQILREIGGETVWIEDEDGNILEAMYFDINKFKKFIINNGGQFYSESKNGNMTIRSFNPELTKLLNDFDLDSNEIHHPDMDQTIWEYTLPKTHKTDATTEENHIVIMTQGNASILAFNRYNILNKLMKGGSVIIFDISGTGRSTGKPDEETTYKNIESVYRFVKSLGYKDSEITVHGFCLGSGPATKIAKEHGCNLIVDRAFAKVGDPAANIVAQKFIAIIANQFHITHNSIVMQRANQSIIVTLSALINWFVIGYNNEENLKNFNGPSVICVHAQEDEVIPNTSQKKITDVLTKLKTKVKVKVIISNEILHNSFWTDSIQDNAHQAMRNANTMRRFVKTNPPLFLLFNQLNAKEQQKQEQFDRGVKKTAASTSLVLTAIGIGGAPLGATTSALVICGQLIDRCLPE